VASLSQGRTAAAQCGLFTHKSVPVIFEPPCTCMYGSKIKQYKIICLRDYFSGSRNLGKELNILGVRIGLQ